MKKFLVTITAENEDLLRTLLWMHRHDTLQQTMKHLRKGNVRVDALVDGGQLAELRKRRLQFEIKDQYESLDKAVRSVSDLAEQYLGIEEVEDELSRLAAEYPGLMTRIGLPHRTWLKKSCHAVKLSGKDGAAKIGIYFIGGVHAREWVCPDALIYFLQVVAESYASGRSLKLKGREFSIDQVKRIVDGADLFIFPQVNPDGRHISLSGQDATQRKNYKEVDINRNYDFLWNYTKYFNLGAGVANSKEPYSQTYIGPEVESEPETRNVIWMFDKYPWIRFFVDVHSYGEKILHAWGDDENQTQDPEMNFQNREFDGKRGPKGDEYGEYMSPGDLETRRDIGERVKEAIESINGNRYEVMQSRGLYPTAGTSTQYATSRCFTKPGSETVHAYTFECGPHFQPRNRDQVIEEVTSGLLEFCLAALDVPADIYLRDNLLDTGAEPNPGGVLFRSPDIHNFQERLANPQAVLGHPKARMKNDLFETIEVGQDNYVYVRLQNRGSRSAGARVDVYWTPQTTFASPKNWNLLGTLEATGVVAGDLTVLGPLVWSKSDIPRTGHYCFIAVVDAKNEPKPDRDGIKTLDDFHALVRQSNKVAWKNFAVEDHWEDSLVHFDFLVRGWPRRALATDLEIDLTDLKGAARVEVKVLERLIAGASLDGLTRTKRSGRWHWIYRAEPGRVNRIRGTRLKPSDHSKVSLRITLPSNIRDGAHDIAVVQRINGKEVGRVTQRIVIGGHPFVANRRSREIHTAHCPWVKRMAAHNKRAFHDVQTALRRGYNGCRTCLRAYDTD